MSPLFDRARFAAREFVAEYERRVGVTFPPTQAEAMRLCFEAGYLRGAGAGMDYMVDAVKEVLP